MKRVLLLATTTGYQIRMFGEAAVRLGVRLVFATDRCDQLDDPWWDGAIAVRFHDEALSLAAIEAAIRTEPLDGVLAVGDRPTVLAAHAAQIAGLPGHPPEAAAAARDKRLARARLAGAGLPVPRVITASAGSEPVSLADRVSFPCVVKPTVLSGSRGVIRADDRRGFADAFDRVRAILASPDVRALHDADASTIQIEEYIDGVEYALEGVLDRGSLRPLALFDKPDPLEGPFFEETIYVTPSRAPEATQAAIVESVRKAAGAIGLWHGPIHGEVRVGAGGVFVIEVAARPIGGLCARALAFIDGDGGQVSLEELLLRHAVGEPLVGWRREPSASGVMMIPIPRAGRYRRVSGVEDARAVPGIEDVTITAKPDQQLVPLPEGASYLGFIFARAGTPYAVERALRTAHARLAFAIDTAVPMAQAR